MRLWHLAQVIDMPEHNPGQMGGTMRLGKRRTIFKSDSSVMRKTRSNSNQYWEAAVLTNSPSRRYWCRFQANCTETPSTWRSDTDIASRFVYACIHLGNLLLAELTNGLSFS